MRSMKVLSLGAKQVEKAAPAVYGCSSRRAVAALCVVAAWVTASSATADEYDARTPGFRFGRMMLRAQGDVGAGFNSNVFSSEAGVQTAPMLRVGAGLRLKTLEGDRLGGAPPPKVAFDAGVRAAYLQVFEDQTRGNVSTGGDIRLQTNPRGRVRFIAADQFNRTVLPFTEAGAIDDNYARFSNNVEVGVEAASKGDALLGRLTYGFGASIFEGDSFDFANRLSHTVAQTTAWKFFPNSNLQHRLEYSFFDLYNFDAADPSATQLLSDTHQVHTALGVNTALTPRWAYTLEAGYAAGWLQDDRLDDRDTFLANAEVRYTLEEALTVGLGYERDLVISPSSRSIVTDTGYLDLSTGVIPRVKLSSGFEAGYWQYSRFLDANGNLVDPTNPQRNDVVLQVDANADIALLSWLSAYLQANYRHVLTDFEFSTGGTTGPVLDPAEFSRILVWGGLRASY